MALEHDDLIVPPWIHVGSSRRVTFTLAVPSTLVVYRAGRARTVTVSVDVVGGARVES